MSFDEWWKNVEINGTWDSIEELAEQTYNQGLRDAAEIAKDSVKRAWAGAFTVAQAIREKIE